MISITSRWGDFSATFSAYVEYDIPKFKMTTFYHRYSRTYYFRPNLVEGESYIPELRRFIQNILRPMITNDFFYQADRESQLREGYYQALSNIPQPY